MDFYFFLDSRFRGSETLGLACAGRGESLHSAKMLPKRIWGSLGIGSIYQSRTVQRADRQKRVSSSSTPGPMVCLLDMDFYHILSPEKTPGHPSGAE